MQIRAIDSHTGGEPTRVVLEDVIGLQGGTMAKRLIDFRTRFDHLRAGIIREPRGSDVLVGALLTPPVSSGSVAGVIFFNNVGLLGMCGHGTIGVVETLRHIGRIEAGEIALDTPVGTVTATLHSTGEVSFRNVESYRFATDVELQVPEIGRVRGDVAYGGNWFFIVHEPECNIQLSRVDELTNRAIQIKKEILRRGLTGKDGAEIDHIELGGPGILGDSRNFVLCPGAAYDRSPCGTGTSAKLACLYADGKLQPGQEYRQESVTGSVFRGKVEVSPNGVIPTITGRAFVTADATLIFDPEDPLRWGI